MRLRESLCTVHTPPSIVVANAYARMNIMCIYTLFIASLYLLSKSKSSAYRLILAESESIISNQLGAVLSNAFLTMIVRIQ